jgi:hypothetical protein
MHLPFQHLRAIKPICKIQPTIDYFFRLQPIDLVLVSSFVPGKFFSGNIWRAVFGKISAFGQFANYPELFFRVL